MSTRGATTSAHSRTHCGHECAKKFLSYKQAYTVRLTSVDGCLQVMYHLHAGGPPEHSQHIKPVELQIRDALLHHRGNGFALMVPLYAERWSEGGGLGMRGEGGKEGGVQ